MNTDTSLANASDVVNCGDPGPSVTLPEAPGRIGNAPPPTRTNRNSEYNALNVKVQGYFNEVLEFLTAIENQDLSTLQTNQDIFNRASQVLDQVVNDLYNLQSSNPELKIDSANLIEAIEELRNSYEQKENQKHLIDLMILHHLFPDSIDNVDDLPLESIVPSLMFRMSVLERSLIDEKNQQVGQTNYFDMAIPYIEQVLQNNIYLFDPNEVEIMVMLAGLSIEPVSEFDLESTKRQELISSFLNYLQRGDVINHYNRDRLTQTLRTIYAFKEAGLTLSHGILIAGALVQSVNNIITQSNRNSDPKDPQVVGKITTLFRELQNLIDSPRVSQINITRLMEWLQNEGNLTIAEYGSIGEIWHEDRWESYMMNTPTMNDIFTFADNGAGRALLDLKPEDFAQYIKYLVPSQNGQTEVKYGPLMQWVVDTQPTEVLSSLLDELLSEGSAGIEIFSSDVVQNSFRNALEDGNTAVVSIFTSKFLSAIENRSLDLSNLSNQTILSTKPFTEYASLQDFAVRGVDPIDMLEIIDPLLVAFQTATSQQGETSRVITLDSIYNIYGTRELLKIHPSQTNSQELANLIEAVTKYNENIAGELLESLENVMNDESSRELLLRNPLQTGHAKILIEALRIVDRDSAAFTERLETLSSYFVNSGN